MLKNYHFKFRHIIYIFLILFCTYLYFIFYVQGIYRHCVADKCVSVVSFITGRDTYLRVYDQYLLTSSFASFYDYAEYPLETGVLIGKQLENEKIVVISDVLPKVKGNVSKNLTFKTQSNAYYIGDPNAVPFDKLPHF